MKLGESDKQTVINRYTERYHIYGYSPKTLGWDKGKQPLRFHILSHIIEKGEKSFSILDIGCGFGDYYQWLQENFPPESITYHGIDVVPALVHEAQIRFKNSRATIECGDFLEKEMKYNFDYCIGSGIFNFKLSDSDNYQYIESVISKAFNCCNIGVAFDFLSNKVDYQYELTFHSSPEMILSIAYKYTRNVVLRNDYMPFEFSLYMYKDDGFEKEDTIFKRYKRITNDYTI